VTVGANDRRGPFTREELRTMTIQTGSVFGKITDIGKGRIALPHFFPILRGKFVTGVAGKLLRNHVSLMRELRIVDLWFFDGPFFLGALTR
jgi:hypothetical protein